MKKIYKFCKSFIQTFTEDNISVYGAYASFYVIISLVPVLMIGLMIIGRFVTFTSEDFVNFMGNNLPRSVIVFVAYLIDEILANDSFSLFSASAVTLLWTASRGVVAVAKGLDKVYRTAEKSSFIKTNIYGLFYTVIFFAAIFSSLLVMVFGNTIGNFIGQIFPLAIDVVNTVLSATPVVSLLLLTLLFCCMYTFLPNRKLKFKKQIPGAIFASSGWMIFSLLFSLYFDNFSDRSYLYGSLTAIVLLMLWIYCCMIFIFLGGELNRFLMQEGSHIDN